MTFDCTHILETPSLLTRRLEDVHYRFALADTDEKLEKTLKVNLRISRLLTKDVSCPYSPQTQHNIPTSNSQGKFSDRFTSKPRSSQYAAISRNE